jgi:hypothetical protein
LLDMNGGELARNLGLDLVGAVLFYGALVGLVVAITRRPALIGLAAVGLLAVIGLMGMALLFLPR